MTCLDRHIEIKKRPQKSGPRRKENQVSRMQTTYTEGADKALKL